MSNTKATTTTTTTETQDKIATWIDKQSESPYPIWALSAISKSFVISRDKDKKLNKVYIYSISSIATCS